ncbi:MAG TPA: hypothetical protein VE377_01200 [Candidatus Dormibacteraeota bacterium]|nr:hypothetical protein [Candidatus Dormibacteraeota bacterium]
MSNQAAVSIAGSATAPRRLGRSVWAIVAGFLAVAVLSNGTDVVLHKLGIFPPLGQWKADGLFVWATVYRTIYGIIGSYITARLAPQRPMWHAMLGAMIGMILGAAAAAATWNRDMGPHWYPLALVVLAVPCAWIGGRIREMQISR